MNDDQALVDGIQFWAHQFAEHMEFLVKSLQDEADNLTDDPASLITDLAHMQKAWKQVSHNPKLLQSSYMRQSYALLDDVGARVSQLECIPDLVHHMKEEANYFKDSVLRGKYTLPDEIVYWSYEHAENLDFVNCQVPKLIFLQGLGPVPDWFKETIATHGGLSARFRELASANEQGVLEDIAETAGIDSAASQEIFDSFIALKTEHLQYVDALLERIGDLPLTQRAQIDVYQMVRHERHEAIYALNRAMTYV